MRYKSIYILDLETTNLSDKCKILSVCAYRIDDSLKIAKILNIRTNIPCPPSHISYEHLCKTGNITDEQAVKKLAEFLKTVNLPIFGWGMFFERRVLQRYKLKFRKNVIKDYMIIYRKLLNLRHNPKLTTICAKYQIKSKYPAHTAIGDVDRVYKLHLLFNGVRQ